MMNDSLNLMEKLRVKLIAFPAADLSVFDRGKKRHLNLFNQEKVEFVNDKPDVLMFLSGGSERLAVNLVQEYKYYLIIASRENNSWATASEVKAWMNQHNISSTLVDCDDPATPELLENLYFAKNGIRKLHGQRLGLVGTPSDWLVSSVVNPFILQTRLGVEQVDIDWNDLLVDDIKQVSPDFISLFGSTERKDALFESGKIYEGLASLIPFYRLSALSVECFSVVNRSKHTACLALSKLNHDGIPAGCEGDTCSAAGLMLCKEVCGIIPWMANTAHIREDKALFAHCTAPASSYKSFRLETHFETNEGLSLAGDLKGDRVTIFRFDSTLQNLFLTCCKVTARPKLKTACRTQLEVEISDSAKKYFVENPFGNHHLLIPGDFTPRLRLVALLLRMDVVE